MIVVGARLIETLTAALYSEPIILFREYVQNSVDSFQANHINLPKENFSIHICIDRDARKVVIEDNGFGILRDDFLKEMKSISSSKKNNKKNQIGFKGIGRLSGLPFCKKLIFRNKPDENEEIQVFTWNSDEYKQLLNANPTESLEKCISRITNTPTSEKGNRNEHFFSVELNLFTNELFDEIFTAKGELSEKFINELQNLLPIPYRDDFQYKEKIHEKYFNFFGESCENYEFKIYVNNIQLFKPYKNTDIINDDIHFLTYTFPKEIDSDESKIGIMWFSFDYIFKAFRDEDYGISVRSKNMLVNNKQIFADEAAKSKDTPTTYGQLVSGLKGIKGEFLINTKLLHDNSKRDWFTYDEAGLFLRIVIVDFMKKMNLYRRNASKYFHSETHTEEQKEKLVKFFTDFVSESNTNSLYNEMNKLKSKEKEAKENTSFDINGLESLKDKISSDAILILHICLNSIYNYCQENDKEAFFKIKRKILEELKAKYKE